jgi:hypothetical protein
MTAPGISRDDAGMTPLTSAAPAVHVVPDADGAWLVIPEGAGRPASRHAEATGAARAAFGFANAHDVRTVVLRDRYGRVRTTPVRR